MDAAFEEIVDQPAETVDFCRIEASSEGVPSPLTPWQPSQRVSTYVWRRLPDPSAAGFGPGGYSVLDTTGFVRGVVSSHYVGARIARHAH